MACQPHSPRSAGHARSNLRFRVACHAKLQSSPLGFDWHAESGFEMDGMHYDAGSFVVPAAQPKVGLIS